jgi:hypothetical protein
MPAIRGQTVLFDGYEIETVEFGLRRIQFEELVGNDVRLTVYLNGVQAHQETLNNPSLTTLYTWVATWLFPGSTVSADGKTMNVDNGALFVSWHLVQRNPLQLKLLTSNAAPPDNWWQV